jgi:hypothetical protein
MSTPDQLFDGRVARFGRFDENNFFFGALDSTLPAVQRLRRADRGDARGELFRNQLFSQPLGGLSVRNRGQDEEYRLFRSGG